MQSPNKCRFLELLEDTKEVVRKSFNLDQPGRLDESIDRLQEWVQSQHHFNKKDFSRDFLEMFIIKYKGSVEKAKWGLENHCVVKTFGKKFFTTELALMDLDDIDDLISAPMPKLTKDHHRIFIFRISVENFGPNIIKNYGINAIFNFEALLRYDYSMGSIVIYDLRKAQTWKLGPLILQDESRSLLQVLIKGYQTRIQSVHILSDSGIINTVINSLRSVISPKIMDRVIVHKTIDTLHDHIDKDLLCSDFGGKEKPLPELAAEWTKFLSSEENLEYCKESFKATIDISKRPKSEYDDENFGMSGTFRSLHID